MQVLLLVAVANFNGLSMRLWIKTAVSNNINGSKFIMPDATVALLCL